MVDVMARGKVASRQSRVDAFGFQLALEQSGSNGYGKYRVSIDGDNGVTVEYWGVGLSHSFRTMPPMKQRVSPGRNAGLRDPSQLRQHELGVSRYWEDRRGLTITFRDLLLLLPSFFSTSDEVLTFVLRMVNFLLVMGFLQRPSVPNTVEHSRKKSCVSDDLGKGLGRSRVCREWMETDVHSWSCHDQVLNERASGKCFGGEDGHKECEVLKNRKVLG